MCVEVKKIVFINKKLSFLPCKTTVYTNFYRGKTMAIKFLLDVTFYNNVYSFNEIFLILKFE